MPLHPLLQIRLYDNDLTSPTLIEDLTERVMGLKFGTALNGGFKFCTFTLATGIGAAWNWLSREGKKGYHFNRIAIHEEQTMVWEGRITDITLQVGGGNQFLGVTAQGYWGSTHDQYYSDDDGSRTDWTSGSNHQIDDIIKEVLTAECPDINSDQTNIAAGSRDLVGINLSARAYPQDIINNLTNLSDDDGAVWFFAIWDNRVPYLFKRVATQIDWYVWLEDLGDLRLQQSAVQLRNAIIPTVGGTEGTTQTDTTSLALYPRRELKVALQTGTNANTQADAAGMAVVERALPRQQQSFSVSGRIYRTAGDTGGRLEQTPLWRVRAGEVIRIQDLVPSSAATPGLDDVRTFYIMETSYDADTNVLTIQPDRRSRRLSDIVGRSGNVEQ
jgi:hypothetical protein